MYVVEIASYMCTRGIQLLDFHRDDDDDDDDDPMMTTMTTTTTMRTDTMASVQLELQQTKRTE